MLAKQHCRRRRRTCWLHRQFPILLWFCTLDTYMYYLWVQSLAKSKINCYDFKSRPSITHVPNDLQLLKPKQCKTLITKPVWFLSKIWSGISEFHRVHWGITLYTHLRDKQLSTLYLIKRYPVLSLTDYPTPKEVPVTLSQLEACLDRGSQRS